MPFKKGTKLMPGIQERKDGTYYVRIDLPDPKTGKRITRRGTAESLEDAVKLRQSILDGGGTIAKPTRMRFDDFVEQWLSVRSASLAESTKERYVYSCAHLSVAFGDYFVDAMTASDVEQWLRCPPKKLAAATMNGYLRVLREVLESAVIAGHLIANPAKAIRGLREGRTRGRRGRSLGPDEFVRFIDAVERCIDDRSLCEDVGRLILTLAWTGLRLGEALALKWSDVLDDELRVERSVWRGLEKSTKTNEERAVAIPVPLAEVFASQRRWLVERQHGGLASGLVFPARRRNRWGTWHYSASAAKGGIDLAVKASGVPPVTAHSFRRTWTRLQRKAGVDALVRRSNAGWQSERIESVYDAVDKDDRKAGADRVVAMLGRVKG